MNNQIAFLIYWLLGVIDEEKRPFPSSHPHIKALIFEVTKPFQKSEARKKHYAWLQSVVVVGNSLLWTFLLIDENEFEKGLISKGNGHTLTVTHEFSDIHHYKVEGPSFQIMISEKKNTIEQIELIFLSENPPPLRSLPSYLSSEM